MKTATQLASDAMAAVIAVWGKDENKAPVKLHAVH